jgi:hypothetical protein
MSLLAQTSTQQLVTSSITATVAQFQTLSTVNLNVSSINGIVPGAPFSGSTLGLSSATVNTSSLTGSYVRAVQGYISSLVVDSLAIGSNFGFINMGDVIATSISTLQVNTGVLTATGAVCTPQLIVSSINGSAPWQQSLTTSTLQGLGTAGYVSSTQLASTVQGLGIAGYVSNTQVTSTIQGLGTAGYVSSSQLISTTQGLGTAGYISSLANVPVLSTLALNVSSINGQTIAAPIQSTVIGLGGAGYISTATLNSTVTGLSLLATTAFTGSTTALSAGTITVSSLNSVQAYVSSLRTDNISAAKLYANNVFIGNTSTQSAILFPGVDGSFKGTAIAEQTTGVGTQELLIYKVSTATDQIRMQTTGNIVFEAGAALRSWPSTGVLATPTLYIAGTTSNVGVGTATPATTLDVAGTGRFITLSSFALNISSINGIIPGAAFNGSTLGLSSATVNTSTLTVNTLNVSTAILKMGGSVAPTAFGFGVDTLTLQTNVAYTSGV